MVFWEYCGLLTNENCLQRRVSEMKLYAEHEYSDRNQRGRLTVTKDGPKQGLDSDAINKLTRSIFVE